MKSFKQFIHEARRNPELNPKVGATEYLRKYKDRDDIYISFTKIPKLGLNPKSDWNTPIGVYTYPLKQFWEYYNVEKRKTVELAAPFAGISPYIQILKGKHTKSFIRDFSKYTERDLQKDKERILSEVYKSSGSDGQLEIFPIFEEGEGTTKSKTPFGKLWNITRLLSDSSPVRKMLGIRSNKSLIAWTELLRNLGFTGFSDIHGEGIIHDAEPVQAVFLTAKEYTQIDSVENKEYDEPNSYNRTNTGLDWTGGTWNGGTWKDGTWCGGRWKDGYWYDGTWKNGTWEKGVWQDGSWENGTWKHGIFEAGTWESGTWKNGTFMWGKWLDGTWENGSWIGGFWNKGTWNYGEWCNGTWKGGIWKHGMWYDGTWCNGTWNYGVWNCGIWYDGTWWNGTWENGTWYDGIWNDGTWNNGTWKDGIWNNGKWRVGTIYSSKYKGLIGSVVNPKTFCQYESESNSLEELKSKLR
jgi:hypothetical protein